MAQQLTGDELEALSGYTHRELIGKGGFGTVYGGSLLRRAPVAIKRPNPGDNAVAECAKELASLCRVASDFVVAPLAYCADPPALVFERLTPLMERLLKLAPRDAWRIAADIASGLAAMHAKGIVHRDVKPANVVLRLDGGDKRLVRALLCDLGIAATVARATNGAGTLGYVAPEVNAARIRGTPLASHPAHDVYSLGVTVAARFALRDPDVDAADGGIAALLRAAPASLQPLLATMTSRDPTARPPIADVIKALERLQNADAPAAAVPPPAAAVPPPAAVAADVRIEVGFGEAPDAIIARMHTGVTYFEASFCAQVNDAVVTAVAQRCPRLKELGLWGCPFVTDASLVEVARNCKELSELDVGGTKATDVSIRALVDACGATLTVLNLNDTAVTDATLQALALKKPRLQNLHLIGTKVSDAAVATFKAAVPGCTVW